MALAVEQSGAPMSAIFYPTRGPAGSIYQTRDGKCYVRTPFGTRSLPSEVGPSLYSLQLQFVYAATVRRVAHALFLAVGLVYGFIVGRLLF